MFTSETTVKTAFLEGELDIRIDFNTVTKFTHATIFSLTPEDNHFLHINHMVKINERKRRPDSGSIEKKRAGIIP